jgi:hypothetical protein
MESTHDLEKKTIYYEVFISDGYSICISGVNVTPRFDLKYLKSLLSYQVTHLLAIRALLSQLPFLRDTQVVRCEES